MAKIHLAQSETPIVGGDRHWTKAVCGVVVKGTEIVFMWDEQIMGGEIEIPVISTCRQCVENIVCNDDSGERRYVYGITERKSE